MLHLARKAFYPAVPPFPLLHVDTTWKFRAMYEFRDRMAREARHGADRARESGGPRAGHQSVHARLAGAHRRHEDAGPEAGARQVRLRRRLRRRAARRGEESRPRSASSRSARRSIAGIRRTSGPSCGSCTTRASSKGESIRVFPLSNWTELDVWQYIHLENIPIVPLYFAAERPVVERDGALIMVDDERMPLRPGRAPAAEGACASAPSAAIR